MGIPVARAVLSAAVLATASPALASSRDAIPVPATAVAVAAPDAVKPRVEVRLLIDATPAPGRVARVGALFRLDPGWHLYWRNPGESGLPTNVSWQVDGGEVGPLAWPAPEVFRDEQLGESSYGYSGQVLLASDLVRLGPPQGPRAVRVDADFLVCHDQCIPGKVSLSRDLDRALAGGASAELATRTHELFERFAARVPVPAAKGGVELAARALELGAKPGDPIRAQLTVRPCARAGDSADSECGVESAAFIPDQSALVALSDARSDAPSPATGAFTLALAGHSLGEPAAARLAGVLELRQSGGGVRFVELDLPLAGESGAVAPSGASDSPSFGYALLLALVGGLILNAMPCVLPVLALKVFALADLGRQSRQETTAHALGYFVGIEVTMLALASGVVALRAAGTYVGWGFQFQEPRFALAITLLLVGFALNLFGVFEIGSPTALASVGQDATGIGRSFFDGLLAVVLATPCSAPFLGTAVGFAFAGSAAAIVAIFAAIGLGLAAPVCLVALAPVTARYMPRSGAWMGKLRVGLGFALLASAIWTLWIFGRTAGADALAGALALCLALGLCAWLYGLFQLADRPGRGLVLAAGVAALALTALRPLWSAPPAAAALSHSPAAHAGWRPFDRGAIAAELSGGRPVFVDFTAAWCLTCAVNERAVIADARVQAELSRADFALFKADWTLRDDDIRRELAHFGRAGVPLYVVYHPDAPGAPRVLSELLTIESLLDALRAGESHGA
ncbi:MAG TPA: protein-disulfide reductase DsbD domain-containing protein [Myxococcota bacterium]|nr:protein-disulfide reductase DsbD domain-containing protein [Myxococcota bacterium]